MSTWTLLKNIPFRSKRELSEVVELPCETLVRLVNQKEKREYTLYYYSIRNLDRVLLIKRNGLEDEASLINNLIVLNQEYSNDVGDLSRRYRIPYEIAVVFGTDEKKYILFRDSLKKICDVRIGEIKALRSAHRAKKDDALYFILGKKCYDALKIESLSIAYKSRLCDFIEGRCFYLLNRKRIKLIPTNNPDYIFYRDNVTDIDDVTISQIKKLRQELKKEEGLREILSEKMYKELNIEKLNSIEIDKIANLVWNRCMHELKNKKDV